MRKGWSRRIVVGLASVGLAVALASLALTSCQPTVKREVLLIGDSVTLESTRAIVESFNNAGEDQGRYAPVFGSVVIGQGLTVVPGVAAADVDAYWAAHLSSLMEHVDPEVIVVELGYNDCGTMAGYGERVDAFMRQIPRSTPVHWLTVADPEQIMTCDERINDALTQAARTNPNLTLLPYRELLDRHPEWTRDGIHLTGEGQERYATWLWEQLEGIYPSASPDVSRRTPPSGAR